MSRIFVYEPVPQNISMARRFGSIDYIFLEGENRKSIWDVRFDEEVILRLTNKRYEPMVDYFLLIGSQIVTFRIAVALTVEFGEFQVLMFNAGQQKYVEMIVGEPYDDDTSSRSKQSDRNVSGDLPTPVGDEG